MRSALTFLILSLALSACSRYADFTAPKASYSMTAVDVQADSVVLAGYRRAVACVGASSPFVRTLASSSLYIVPGESFDYDGNTYDGNTGTNIRGYYDVPSRSLYVVNMFRGNEKVWAHEFLHSFGLEHGDVEFTRCGLLSASGA